MAKFIRHDYGAIHDALNKMIVAEVKDDKTVNLPNESLLTAGYVTEWALRQATEKTI